MASEKRKPSLLTRVLLKRTHGGRKEDSKFWRSEFDVTDERSPRPKKNSFFAYLLTALGGFVAGCIVLSFYYSPDFVSGLFSRAKDTVMQQVSTLSNAAINTINRHRDRETTPAPTADKVAIREAVEEILQEKKGEVAPEKERPEVNQAPMYLYQIDLFSGGSIFTDNAIIEGDTITYTGDNGLVVSLKRDQVKTMKKIRIK